MDVQIVVSGRLGDLTTWTLSGLMLSWDVEVVALRELPRRASRGAPTSHLVTDPGVLDR